MKKFVSMAVALTLIFAMSLGVCAAPSVTLATTVTGPDGSTVTVNEISDSDRKEANDKLAEILGSSDEAKGYKEAVAIDIAGTEPGAYTISVPGVKPGDKVIVLHKCSQHGVWEELEATVGNGTVTVTFHSFSPVVIYVKAGAASPKTADASLTTAACVAMLAAAGLAISKKKFA